MISIIIATKNEEYNIERCIKSLLGQSHQDSEIIVVDNNSSDRTMEIAKKYTDKVYNLGDYFHLNQIKNYRGAQINLGISKSKGDIIFFPDADMTFDSSLLSEAIEKLKYFDALYIPEIIVGNGYFGKLRNFERSFYNGTPIDAVRMVKKIICEKVGGFDENIQFGPDDWDFTKKLKSQKCKTATTESCIFHHEDSLTMYTYIRKKWKYIDSFTPYIEKWSENDPDIRKQFGFVYRFILVFVENNKWKQLIKRPDLAIGMYSLKLLVGLGLIRNKIYAKLNK